MTPFLKNLLWVAFCHSSAIMTYHCATRIINNLGSTNSFWTLYSLCLQAMIITSWWSQFLCHYRGIAPCSTLCLLDFPPLQPLPWTMDDLLAKFVYEFAFTLVCALVLVCGCAFEFEAILFLSFLLQNVLFWQSFCILLMCCVLLQSFPPRWRNGISLRNGTTLFL